MYKSIELRRIDGSADNFKNYDGCMTLVVNVASLCGHTHQYAMLEALYQKYKSRGFIILGFPCNQFGEQEPGSEEEIASFCRREFGVTFPIFKKTEVNGDSEHDLYRHLKLSNPMNLQDTSIKWNFTKYLVDRTGEVLLRIQPPEMPLKLLDTLITNV